MSLNRRELIKGGILTAAALVVSRNLIAFSAPRTHQVINAGIGGNNTVDLLHRIDQDCLKWQPETTILMAGTNDMNSVKHVPIEQFEKNLDKLASKIVANGSRLLLMTVLPAYEPYLLTRHPAAFYQPEGYTARLKAVNKVVIRVAAKHKAGLVDLSRRFEAIGKIGTDKDSLIQNEANANKTDGIHPTANGYRFIALTVFDFLLHFKYPVGKIVCFGDSITRGDGSSDRDSYPAYLSKLLNQSND